MGCCCAVAIRWLNADSCARYAAQPSEAVDGLARITAIVEAKRRKSFLFLLPLTLLGDCGKVHCDFLLDLQLITAHTLRSSHQ